jgi:hypothetical protein
MNPRRKKRHLLTDDGELIDPVPVLETDREEDDQDDEKAKHKRLPEASLLMSRARKPEPADPIPRSFGLLFGAGFLLLLASAQVSPCIVLLGVLLLSIGAIAFDSRGAASFGRDGIPQPIRRLPPYRDLGDDQMNYWE